MLSAAAKELNDVLGLEPLINSKAPPTELIEQLKEAAVLIDPVEDEFTPETQAVLDQLDQLANPPDVDKEIDKEKVEEEEKEQVQEELKEKEGKGEKKKTKKKLRVEKPKKATETVPVKDDKEKEKKTGTKKKPRSLTARCVDYLTPLIKEGKYTRKELIQKAEEEFPEYSRSSTQTLLTDAKNPKYNKFDKLVVANSEGILSFE